MPHEKLIHSPEEVEGANHLSEYADRLMRASKAHNTQYAYASMLKGFDAWLNGRAVDDVSIANYLAFLEKSGKAVATARLALAVIRSRVRRNGWSQPDGPITASALEGFGRNNANLGRGQAQGIEWEQADAMVSLAASNGSLAGLRDAALIAVMSDCLLRISEAAGVTGRVSGHSLRVGSAQSLVSAGASLPELQQAGRWLSPEMPAHYARGQLARMDAVARLRPDS